MGIQEFVLIPGSAPAVGDAASAAHEALRAAAAMKQDEESELRSQLAQLRQEHRDLDVGTAGNNGYMAFGLKASMWTTATEDRSSQVTGSTSFDFNGSGQNKVIYADEISLHVFDGATGKELYTAPHASYTAR